MFGFQLTPSFTVASLLLPPIANQSLCTGLAQPMMEANNNPKTKIVILFLITIPLSMIIQPLRRLRPLLTCVVVRIPPGRIVVALGLVGCRALVRGHICAGFFGVALYAC